MAQKLGVASIELEATGELAPKNLTQTGRREITHLLRSHDLAVSAIVCPLRRGLDVAENLEPRLEQIRDALALAFDLGPRLVILPIGKLPEVAPLAGRASDPGLENPPPLAPSAILLAGPDDLTTNPSLARPANSAANLLQESLDALGKHGDRTGVNMALEAGLDDPADWLAYLDRFAVGSLGVDYNPANLLLNGFNPYQAIRTFGRRLLHAHAQDARRISPSKLATVPLGHGDLDWIQLLANFEEIDYRGHLTALADDRAELGAAVAFLKRFVVPST
jgi:sugar phosphate isomerase/epimerase